MNIFVIDAADYNYEILAEFRKLHGKQKTSFMTDVKNFIPIFMYLYVVSFCVQRWL